jgi:RHS repeat-associated protein
MEIFSVAAWVKPDVVSGEYDLQPVVTNCSPPDDVFYLMKGWRFGIDSSGKVCLQLYLFEEKGETVAAGTTTLTAGKWYLIAATYDASTDAMKIYLNGADDTSESPTGDYTMGEYFGIGWDGWEYGPGAKVSEYYDGVIDSVGVYDTALSATDVAKLWDTGDKAGLHLTTKEYDDQAGLYYFWQRWYDPKDGRFTQKDPISSVYDYVYAQNNPVAHADPSGEVTVCELLVVCVVIVVLICLFNKHCYNPMKKSQNQAACQAEAAVALLKMTLENKSTDPQMQECRKWLERAAQSGDVPTGCNDPCGYLGWAKRVCARAGFTW